MFSRETELNPLRDEFMKLTGIDAELLFIVLELKEKSIYRFINREYQVNDFQ